MLAHSVTHRLKILLGMWEKGEVISSVFRGVKPEVSWNLLSKETGRDDEALKKWHDLYKKYPSKEKYLPVAEKKAEEWTQKTLQGCFR